MSDQVNKGRLDQLTVSPCSGSGYLIEARYRDEDERFYYQKHAVEDVKSLKEMVAGLVLSPIITL